MRKKIALPLLLPLMAAGLVAACAPSPSEEGGGPVDLDEAALTANGCFDLASALTQMKAMPGSLLVRTSTPKVDVDGDSLRRNFVGVVAFSHFKFAEEPVSVARASWPTVTQNGCETLSMVSGPDGEQHFKITKTDDPKTLILDREDGYHMEWKIEGRRSIRSLVKATIMDRCPEYVTAKATTETVYEWGSAPELATHDIASSRSTLRAISMVVRDMPTPLLALATYDAEDAVKAPRADLVRLTSATIDPQAETCPYRAEPPGGEPPPNPAAPPGPAIN